MWPEGAEENIVKQYWCDDYGDRRQEIVFIGLKAEMSEENIRKQLDACLVTDYLARPEHYATIEDPFPAWFELDDSMVAE